MLGPCDGTSPRGHINETRDVNPMFYSSAELKDNTIIVVLGASGDLAKKKTVSIAYGLFAYEALLLTFFLYSSPRSLAS